MLRNLPIVWSSTGFANGDLSAYAMPRITEESRHGVTILSTAALTFLALAAVMCAGLGLPSNYSYTYATLAALSLHIHFSASRVMQLRALYLLAMLLLIVCGSALVLLAQQSGRFNTMIFLSITVLFMLVPIVPWGLREASITAGAIYLMFTLSTFSTRGRFTAMELWVLQLLMLTAALISIVLVIRALMLRKHDLMLRYDLQLAHNRMTDLSNRDHLTGAWNRRYLEGDFNRVVAAHHAAGTQAWFALFDIDAFKKINDTWGHRQGDDLLKAIPAAFDDLVEPDEYLSRLGGDEFALIISGDEPERRIHAALARIRVAHEVEGKSLELHPTVSMGLIALPAGRIDFDHAYKSADEMLYAAKRAGGARIVRTQPSKRELAEQAG